MTRSKKAEDVAEQVPEVISPQDSRNSYSDPIECMRVIVDNHFRPYFATCGVTVPEFDYTKGFTEDGKLLQSRKIVQLILAAATSNKRPIILLRFRRATTREIVMATLFALPHAVTKSTSHDKELKTVHDAVGLIGSLRHPHLNTFLSREVDQAVAAIGNDFPDQWVDFTSLFRDRNLTDSRPVQVSRMLKVICRSCKPKDGNKGHIIRQSEGSIKSYGIQVCRDHGDMIVELRKKDDPVGKEVPYYVVDADPEDLDATPVANAQ